MSKLIRTTTLVHRPTPRRAKAPVYVIASGGDVFVLKRTKGAFTWVLATEADFGVKLAPAANQPRFDDLNA